MSESFERKFRFVFLILVGEGWAGLGWAGWAGPWLDWARRAGLAGETEIIRSVVSRPKQRFGRVFFLEPYFEPGGWRWLELGMLGWLGWLGWAGWARAGRLGWPGLGWAGLSCLGGLGALAGTAAWLRGLRVGRAGACKAGCTLSRHTISIYPVLRV